jgi:conjugal transfer pilus assembly protein TraV
MKNHEASRFGSFGLAAVMASLTGCASSISGLGGSSDYACKAPEGVTCQSVSGTYANAVTDNLRSTRGLAIAPSRPSEPALSAPASPASATSSGARPPSAPPTSAISPIRSAPLVLRLWFKPWEDADGDLFDTGHVYVQVHGGRWLVEHAQRTNREAHSPVRAAPMRGASEPPHVPSTQLRAPGNPVPLSALPALPALPIRPGSASASDNEPTRD